MEKNRLEAFSDGVLAIVITIMVLELRIPHGDGLEALRGQWHVFLSYVLSFVYVGIYWNNHHHMFHAVRHISGPVLWANLHLLFWLSLFPFVTGWMGENEFAMWPVALYGFVLMMAAVAYFLLAAALTWKRGDNAQLSDAIGRDFKGRLSIALYGLGIASSFFSPWLGMAFYCGVATMWLVPDRRIERRMGGTAP